TSVIPPSTPTNAEMPLATMSHRPPAPYRPGFQPKGVYRPLTDDFMSVRNAARDVGRIERTKLERRLEKLIDLHFSPNAGKTSQPPVNRRASSFFDFDMSELKNVDPSGLWKGMLQSQVSSKSDIRGMVGLFRLPPIHNPIFS